MMFKSLAICSLILCALCNVDVTFAARQNPLKDPKICGRPQCDNRNPKFSYGNALYKYDYTVDLSTEFFGTGENVSELYLKSNVELFFPKPCEGFLRINNVRLWNKQTQDDSVNSGDSGSSNNDAYDYYGEFGGGAISAETELPADLHPKSYELESNFKAHLLRFSFHDGLISEVCPDADEPAWVLNFKKGILSAFQNTMMRFDIDFNTTETDVAGTCHVHYSLESTDDVYVRIRKVKDMSSCRNRYSVHSILQTTPYTYRDDKTIYPILDSQSYCNMTIDSNLYREISCYERHQLIPFSNSSTGAVTTSKSKFQLKAEEPYSSGEFLAEYNEFIGKRYTLIFDHTPAVKPTHGEIKASRDLLKAMCSVGFPNIQREFINVFTNFLQTTKSLDYKALTQLLARSAGICERGKNHVLESLPYIGSTASYQVMRDQIVGNSLPKALAHSWMTSLAFIQRPDEETLETFYTILQYSQKKTDPEYTLCASAVIHSYCKYNTQCGGNEKVKRIVSILETEFLSLFNMFRGERRSRERMIIILKGLGNIGVISEAFAEQLQELIAKDITPIEIRVQSVLAFRRVDCLKYRHFFLEIYKNFSINSEIRTFAYLQAMRCPDYQTIGVIKGTLEDEEINQVGSFVWSHLKNVAKSSSPVRIEAQGLLLNDDLSDKFKLDIRKFSRNYEHSLFFDEYNFGTTTDLNVLFGTDSYLPHTATLNFTTDLFGQSVNLLELSVRAEGFEQLVSSIFSSKGPFNRELFRKKFSFLNRWLNSESSEDDDTLESMFNMNNFRLKRTTSQESNSAEVEEMDDNETEEEHGRLKRSPQTESHKTALQNDIDEFGYKLKYNYNKPRAQLGLRIFGNDLRYYSMDGMRELMALVKEFDPFQQAAKLLSGEEFTFSKSNVLLDASYNAPLGIGLPLSIHVFGASSIDLRISGKLDRLDSSADWYFDVEGRLKPSVSVDVITTMQTDFFYTASGIKVKSNLYTNSEIEAKLKMRGKSLVTFSFNLPQAKNEIFSARSELVVMKDTEEIPQTGIENRRANSTCTWPVLNDAIGLKMCSYYSVPDLSIESDVIYPGLLLSGPSNFSVILTKADETAKSYVFEYKWHQVDNDSNWSLVFHTPDSVVKRKLVANVTTLLGAFNASVSFVNGINTTSAGCNYDNDPNHRRLDVFLNFDNRRLDLNMELRRWQDRSIWVYKPQMLLAINGLNVTGLVGTIRKNEKNGIVQNDVELSFETRKLQALIRGNVVQTEIATSTNMTINYRFQANKVETINFEGRLVNNGDKSKTDYRGNMQLKTTAYPRLNFASNATWLSLQGHTEGMIAYNNAPNFIDPTYTSLARVVFARSLSEEAFLEGSRTRASFEIKVPRSKIDFRILVKHEERIKNGTEHNVVLGLRYAPEKEATALFSVHLPRRNLFAIDGYMNISIPDVNSCTVRLKLTEIATKDYMIYFNGTWFTGHSILVKGNYKDKSSRIEALHQLKLVVESPSFEVTTLHILYRRNQLLMFGNIQARYGQSPYGLTVQYTKNPDKKNTNAELKLKMKEKDYWIKAKLLAEQPKLLQIEMHVDKLRDIHLQLGLLMIEERKEVSLELKWDANRDPSQRLALLAEFYEFDIENYRGNVMVTYPDRTISCGFEAFTGGPEYRGQARVAWGITEVITFRYDFGPIPYIHLNNWLIIELDTPFEGWKRNSLRAGAYQLNNLLLVNSSLLWADDQNLELGFKKDYDFNDEIISFDVRFGINSTIKDIPTMNVKAMHWQDFKKFNSDFDLRYTGANDTFNVYSLKSNWELTADNHHDNVSGTVFVQSPFEGYNRGGLAAKFSLSDERVVSGAASLNFDIREFTLAMNGYVKKFTDNMLTVNITTPLEKFRTINGRFGISEKRRHAVAEVRAPTAALGVEALFDVISLMNFDVRFSIATPIESFQQAAAIAKIKPHTVDVRGILNNVTLGFTGVWLMNSLSDFEYSYWVYTAIPKYEENGFVAKFVRKENFILNVYGKLNYKLGMMINGHPKSKLLTELGGTRVELETLHDDDFRPLQVYDNDEDYDLNDINYDEFLSYFVQFEVDTIVWPTINGAVDVQEVMDYYLIVGDINIPQGRIELKDRLYYPDYINVLNVLNLKTPFAMAKEVKTIFEYHVNLDFNAFYEKIQFFVNNDADELKRMGFELNYTSIANPLKPKQHIAHLNIITPFELLDEIDINGQLEMEEHIYKGNISSKTRNTFVSLAAAVENEENFLETHVGILLNTDVIPHYACNAYFKKDFSDVDNYLDIQFEVTDNGTLNKLQIETAWHKQATHLVNANGRVRTTMLPLKLVETTVLVTTGPNHQLSFDLAFVSQSDERIDYGARAERNREIFNVEIWTPLVNFKNVSMHGSLMQSSSNPNEYTLTGNLYRNMMTYAMNGLMKMAHGYPADTRLRIQPQSGGRDGIIELFINEPEHGQEGFSVEFSAIEDGKMCQISGGYTNDDKRGMDFSVVVQSTEPEIAQINMHGKLEYKEQGRVLGEFKMQSPWKYLGIETVDLRSDITIRTGGGQLLGEYTIGQNIGRGSCSWDWIVAERMQLALESYMLRENADARIVQASARYFNPGKSFRNLVTGGKLNLDSKWNLEVNGTVNYRSQDEFQFAVVTQLPAPVGDIHHVSARYRGNLMSQQGDKPNVYIESKYRSENAKRKFLSRFNYRNVTDLQGMGHIEWGVASNASVIEGDFQMLRKPEVRREFYAKLITPLFEDENTLFIKGSYDLAFEFYHHLICTIDYPSSRRIGNVDVGYKSLSNMHGGFNFTTPIVNVTWLKVNFVFNTTNGNLQRYVHGQWPSDYAFVKLDNKYNNHNERKDLQGTVEVDVPLASRNRIDVSYGLNERENADKGHLEVVHNKQQILNGTYNRLVEHNHPLHKDTMDIALENEMKPLGIHYQSTQDFTDPKHVLTMKHVELFQIRNVSNFNLTGELHTRDLANGQEIKIVAIHPNRTVVLTTNYEDQDVGVFQQKSKLELSETAWIGYNLKVGNNSKPQNESQEFFLEIFYPKRNLSTEGWYYVTDSKFDSDIALKWTTDYDDEAKVVRTGLLSQEEPLRNGDRAHQIYIARISHPDLEKDVTFKGTYYRGDTDLLRTNLVIDYSNNPEHLIAVGATIKDLQQQLGYTNYTLQLFAHHIASEIDVQVNATVAAKPSLYKTESYTLYKRGYFPEKHGQFLMSLDMRKKEIEYIRNSPYRSVRFWAIPINNYPMFGLNGTVWDTPETNNTGYIYVDVLRRYARAEINLTDDASQNLQLVGHIPNNRGGHLDIWRNYEEIRIIDVTSYLKMNHSRLITGRFHWRPQIPNEMKEKVHSVASSIYNTTSDGIDFWIKSVYNEAVEAIGVVWETSKEYNKQFIDDIGELSVLEQDIEDLRLFVNQSYEANDFYIKTVVNFTLTILDELAIRDHIGSLPKIFTEIWQAMGESGKALRNSIVWLIEAIKVTYNNVLDAITRFFHGESLHYLSGLLEKGIEKYDKFVKDLHISFIKYVENLWSKFWTIMSNYWKSILKRFEPYIFKFMSFIESTAWDFSKEVFDFIYKRTNELAESPYFNKVSSFTQDVDRLYKDIKANDAITNIKKYSMIAWNFVKEKYFKIVPFGAELNEVLTEIWGEIKELEKIEQVQTIIQKYQEIVAKLDWIAEELQLEERLHSLYALIRNKFRHYAMNALETADMYREAKTKFIFDPETGVIDLEQKLPMSWHAFDETPKFEEIPEYKFLAQFQSVFSTTNSSLIRYIYNLRSHLDSKTWLPPYYSQAILIDSRHFMTFDKRFTSLRLNPVGQEQCTYLLAHDFSQRNFTLAMESRTTSTGAVMRKLTFVAYGHVVDIDLEEDTLIVNGNEEPMLPLEMEGLSIHRDWDILSIHSNTEFTLNCNIQFNLCTFEVSGWYFGQTAGLFGTLNNERFDDFRMPNHEIARTDEEFSNAWSVHKCKQAENSEEKPIPQDVVSNCDQFFKTDMLSACSDALDNQPFFEMCLDLGKDAGPVHRNHPALRGTCTAALAYIEACTALKIPLRVPDRCVFCELSNGSYVAEGTFVEIAAADVPRSVDVVFIVEAKPCNAELVDNKNMMTVVETLDEQLQEHKLTNNRYAVLAFGGSAPFDKPHNIMQQNRPFVAQIAELKQYFDHIQFSNGTNNDILQALSVASKFNFRPGVSKAFVVLTCSNCSPRDMRFDYRSIAQYLLEEGIVTHILADTEFEFERNRKLRHFFGLDRELVYSRRFPEGDADTRRQVHIPKSNLGICPPLAMETNGSVFSARKLRPERKYPIKRIATIFGKRVAQGAMSSGSKTCECSGHNTGVAYINCWPKEQASDHIDTLDDYDLGFSDWEWDSHELES